MSSRLLNASLIAVFTPFVLALGGSCAHPPQAAQATVAKATQSDDFRAQIPRPAATETLQIPEPQRVVLPNGLTLFLWPKRELPLVRLTLNLKSGSADDPAQHAGLASLTAEALKRGTTSRSAHDIADQVETLGAELSTYGSEDRMNVSIGGLSSNLTLLLELLADVSLHPSFAPKEVTRLKALRKGEILQSESSPRHIASEVFRLVSFNKHPYGHLPMGTRDGIAHVDAAKMRNFWHNHAYPANAAIVAVGDFDPAQLQESIVARFGTWRGGPKAEAPVSLAPRPKPQVTLVDRPGAPQSEVLVGTVGLPRATPDYFAATLCNAVLSGMFNSRINMNLREDKGWTYGARSQMGMMRSAGPLAVGAGIRTDVTGPAVHEILQEMRGLREADISVDELQGAKNRFALSLPGQFESIAAISSQISELYFYDLPLDFYQRLPERLEAVTQADVRRIAETYLDPEAMNVVVIGDAKKVTDELLALGRGPVLVRDVNGRILSKKVAKMAPAFPATTTPAPRSTK